MGASDSAGLVPSSWLERCLSAAYLRILASYLAEPPAFVFREQMFTFLQTRRILSALGADELDHFGWEVGADIEPSAHGAMGFAAVSASNARETLQVIAEYAPIRNHLFSYRVAQAGDALTLQITPRFPLDEYTVFSSQVTLSTFVTLLQNAYGVQILHGMECCLPWPADGADLGRLFKAAPRVAYQAPDLQLRLTAAAADILCVTADATLYRAACRTCEQERALQSGSLSALVRQHLETSPGHWRSLDEVAQRLARSRRSLIRQLAREETSFKAIQDSAREELARFYLAETSMTIGRISEALGYESPTNFSRTFRRWTGLAPGTFRSAQRLTSGVRH